MHRIRGERDLLLVLFFSLLLLLAVYLGSSQLLRAPLGFVYILLVPGYTLVAALFPYKDTLSTANRLILSFGLSIVTVPLIGFLLNWIPWGINLDSMLVSTLVFVLLNCSLAFHRRSRLSFHERFVMHLGFHSFDWRSIKPLDGLLSAALVLSIVTACGALVHGIVKPKIGERFTEFYVLGLDSVASKYPTDIIVQESITLIVGVANHEHANVQYRIEKSESTNTERLASLQLGHQERWEYPCTFTLTEPGENRKVSFLLYKGDEKDPYRSLHLWITVRERPAAP